MTDDERREVAARLRHEARACIHYVLISPDDALRLADLIDPGESGQNLDTNRGTVQQESPAVQKAPGCDREALLALADELDEVAWKRKASDGWTASVLLTINRYTDRIREACGEGVRNG